VRPAEGHAAGKLGPGRLVVVVGPSGAGKDTLIAIARDHCRDNPKIVFPRRVVTRASTTAEDHDSISDEIFDASVRSGAFTVWWAAHGLQYGIPAAIDDEIRAGKIVVCNMSRAVVARLRQRYADCRVVLVTAPKDILAARLARRDRVSDGDPSQRLARAAPDDRELNADVVIENVGTPERAAAALVGILM
jgi:ribose 1,5-bisphosphokinase